MKEKTSRRVFFGRGETYNSDVVIDGVRGKNLLEIMAGANKWHERARFVFLQNIMTNQRWKEEFEIITNYEMAESMFFEGKNIVLSGSEENVFGYRRIGVNLYREFERQVTEFGHGDVSEYAKRSTGLTRKQIDLKMTSYFNNH